MTNFKVENFGQIREADIDFGDLTVFIGPQASGKTILLELFKLVLDYSYIATTLKRFGFTFKNDKNSFLNLYFGENMSNLWKSNTSIMKDARIFDLSEKIDKSRSGSQKSKEKLFYIPAQRAVTLADGWPRSFMSFKTGDLFVMKNFSEHLRLLMEAGLGSGKAIFPQDKRLKSIYRDEINQSIFHSAQVKLDTSTSQRRIILDVNGITLPYMNWSTGQREFLPLLLGLYWLIPSSGPAGKKECEWVIIEEPEMGLHSGAIQTFILTIFELLDRGYKVIISTHSSTILTVLWFIKEIRESKGKEKDIAKLFNVNLDQQLKKVFNNLILNKKLKAYYFNLNEKSGKQETNVTNISSLDPFSDNPDISDWGGLTNMQSQSTQILLQLDGEDK